MYLWNVVILFFAFLAVLYGADIIVKSVDRFSHKLRVSSFAISFFLLGMLTSIPELAVGLAAVSEGTPEVYIGNLLGGSAIIFFVVIPILAIFGKGVRINGELTGGNLKYSLLTILAPATVLLDRKITNLEGGLLILFYALLFIFIQRKKGVFDENNTEILHIRSYSVMDVFKMLFGVAVVFVGSNLIVHNLLIVAKALNLSTFFVSLVLLSIGTNLPELSLAIKSVVLKRSDIAFGDYIGSAAANTLLFGIFTLITPGQVLASTVYHKTFIMMSIGFLVFYQFAKSKHSLSKKEGIALLVFYIIFVLVEKL
jgi:cation:H+ antiporter